MQEKRNCVTLCLLGAFCPRSEVETIIATMFHIHVSFHAFWSILTMLVYDREKLIKANRVQKWCELNLKSKLNIFFSLWPKTNKMIIFLHSLIEITWIQFVSISRNHQSIFLWIKSKKLHSQKVTGKNSTVYKIPDLYQTLQAGLKKIFRKKFLKEMITRNFNWIHKIRNRYNNELNDQFRLFFWLLLIFA